MKLLLLAGLIISGIACVHEHKPGALPSGDIHPGKTNPFFAVIGAIPVPEGFFRRQVPGNSFPGWLRNLPLKKDRTVYLYNGQKKKNQLAQYAVLDISTGNRDIQQCADAVIRLRAEYFFEKKNEVPISFIDFSGKEYRWNGGHNRQQFDSYLANVFGWCGSASLEKQMKKVMNAEDMQPGDVFVKGGFPGHAVIVADMAENASGEKIFMLAQGYMPAQDIHILVNPLDAEGGPWYYLTDADKIYTPEWTFSIEQLKRW